MHLYLGHGVLYFKLFSVLLQEMTFEIDEDFLYALLDFSQFDNTAQAEEE
jgi:vacuolar protein sorting-associated protein 13A/C